jgi:hypothetical protein
MTNLMTNAMRRTVSTVVLTVIATALVGTTPADAGGCDGYYPVKDRYEPGEVITMVGYSADGLEGLWDSGPYVGLVRSGYDDDPEGTAAPVAVGQVEIIDVAEYIGWPGARPRPAVRASISFTITPHLAPGRYSFDAVGQDEAGVGWLCFGSLNLGVDPDHPIDRSYSWPPDEPEWPNVVTIATPVPTTMPPPAQAIPTSTTTPTTFPSTTTSTSSSTTVAPPPPTTTPTGVDGSAEFASSAIAGSAEPTNEPPGWLVGLGSLALLGAALVYGQRRTISQTPSEDRT